MLMPDSSKKITRARDLGIPFPGSPGPLNAITDVGGVEVGHVTLWRGSGPLVVGQGPVRTGVTAVLPRGRRDPRLCFGGSFALNASGEMTGLAWLEERGFLEGPVLLTNTHSVGIVRDSAIQWMRRNGWRFDWTVPVVGETYDGFLNDIDGGHIRPEHVFEALNNARSGSVEEGSVGGGTGMICYEYKGGIGTSSRIVPGAGPLHQVGVLVQTNYGRRGGLRIAGFPVGKRLTENMPHFADPAVIGADVGWRYPKWWLDHGSETSPECAKDGSIIVLIATDAPLLPHQLRRLAKRPALALGRLGGLAAGLSGEIFLAFSTANAEALERGPICKVDMYPNLSLDGLFEAAIDATEEAVLNALVAASGCEGANGLQIAALPHQRVREELELYGLSVRRPCDV